MVHKKQKIWSILTLQMVSTMWAQNVFLLTSCFIYKQLCCCAICKTVRAAHRLLARCWDVKRLTRPGMPTICYIDGNKLARAHLSFQFISFRTLCCRMLCYLYDRFTCKYVYRNSDRAIEIHILHFCKIHNTYNFDVFLCVCMRLVKFYNRKYTFK